MSLELNLGLVGTEIGQALWWGVGCYDWGLWVTNRTPQVLPRLPGAPH